MKKSRLIGALSAAVLSFITQSSHATLTYVLGGLAVYDSDANLSWLTDANAIAGTTFDNGSDGRADWDSANAWAASLDIDGVAGADGWRLPTTLQPDASCSNQFDPGGSLPVQGFAFNCTGSEMGNLYHVKGVTAATPWTRSASRR